MSNVYRVPLEQWPRDPRADRSSLRGISMSGLLMTLAVMAVTATLVSN